VFKNFKFWYHGYFIYGNIGETEEEMLRIPDFAHELGLHAIGLSRLHMDKFTPLRKVVEETPGYWIGPNGHVYSKDFDKARLRSIRNKIRNRFWYRPGQMKKIFSTLIQNEIVTPRQLFRLSLFTPWIAWDYIASRTERYLRHRSSSAASL
jgi:hypothetical protein